MAKTLEVKYICSISMHGNREWAMLTNDMLTGRYLMKNGFMFIEIEEKHHFLWLVRWTKKRWIQENHINFIEDDIEIFECSKGE